MSDGTDRAPPGRSDRPVARWNGWAFGPSLDRVFKKEKDMKRLAWVLALGFLLPGRALLAAGPAKTDPPLQPVRFQLEAETFQLPNGMTFVLSPRKGAPTFAGYIAFRVGGVDSVPGDTGLAHMFEHMAFKGTQHTGTTDWAKEKPVLDEIQAVGDKLTELKASGKGSPEEIDKLSARLKELMKEDRKFILKEEFDKLMTQAGGRAINASTSEDYTQYFVMLPSSALELWMLLESQRIREPVMREFYSERDVISQERLMRTDNDPMGKLYEQFLATAFMAHPYRLPTIGWASDVPALTMKQAQDFYFKYYSPSNAVGVLVGNFDPKTAKALVERYFGDIPRRGDPAPIVTREPRQEHERRVDVVFDANPQMLVGWHKPAWPSPDDTRLDLVATLMGDGLTSRLYKRLVEKERLASDASASNGEPGGRYDNLFVVYVTPNSDVSYGKVEEALFEEIDRMKIEPVSAAELEKAKTRILATYVRRLDSPLSTAMLIGSTFAVTGDWKSLYTYVEDVQRVTVQDVQKVVSEYLTAENRTVAELVKPAASEKEVKP
jgi:predicted Zn-dependent peptidase